MSEQLGREWPCRICNLIELLVRNDVPEDYLKDRPTKAASISDEEISLAIRYLDPEPRQNTSSALAFVAVFIIVFFVFAILFWLRLRGL
jgi:hypothetical protein